jgi:polyisoprenoid-binding protein YceI
METKTFDVINSQSGIEWTGRKITGAHNGTIGIKSGTLVFEKDKLTSAKLVIDITSIKILDIIDPVANAQFAGHLASDDFFASDAFPTATFETTSVIAAANGLYHNGKNCRQDQGRPYYIWHEIPFRQLF